MENGQQRKYRLTSIRDLESAGFMRKEVYFHENGGTPLCDYLHCSRLLHERASHISGWLLHNSR